MSDPLITPSDLVTRLFELTNAHDLEGLVGCFGPDYALTNPVHPGRDFVGPGQVRRNWMGLFAGVPDLTASVRSMAPPIPDRTREGGTTPPLGAQWS